MSKKNYDKKAKERWRRKLEKEKLKKEARFERMYQFTRTMRRGI